MTGALVLLLQKPLSPSLHWARRSPMALSPDQPSLVSGLLL